jgi:hypothetical protein
MRCPVSEAGGLGDFGEVQIGRGIGEGLQSFTNVSGLVHSLLAFSARRASL